MYEPLGRRECFDSRRHRQERRILKVVDIQYILEEEHCDHGGQVLERSTVTVEAGPGEEHSACRVHAQERFRRGVTFTVNINQKAMKSHMTYLGSVL